MVCFFFFKQKTAYEVRISDWSSDVCSSDLIDVFHAFGDRAPDGILAVEEAGIVEADEELAVGAVRILGARHRAGAAHMRLVVELGIQLLARTAGAIAARIAGLGHEALDHPVELHAVIKTFAHQFLDAGDMVNRKSTRLNSSH